MNPDKKKPKMLYSDNDIYVLMKKHGLTYVTLADGRRVEAMNGAQAADALLEMRTAYEAKRGDQKP